MRSYGSPISWSLSFLLLAGLLGSCDDRRVFEDNHEFAGRAWLVKDEPVFEFTISDSIQTYNVCYNVRNSLDYPSTRINVTYTLFDSAGLELKKKLVYNNLFEPSGRPLGESGLGDLYDHQFPILTAFRFPTRGKFAIRLTQFMRQDTVPGILSVGIRVERNPNFTKHKE